MSFLGEVFKATGKVVGKTTEIAFKATGEIVGVVANELGANHVAEVSRNIGNDIGDISNSGFTKAGNSVGIVIDTTLDIAIEVGGDIGESVAGSMGATFEDKMKGRKIGSVIGGASAGFLVGDLIGAGITTVTAASAAASTGTAISTLHGAAQTSATFAHIGGGTMVVGNAILSGINVVTTVDGAKTGMNKSVYNVTNLTSL